MRLPVSWAKHTGEASVHRILWTKSLNHISQNPRYLQRRSHIRSMGLELNAVGTPSVLRRARVNTGRVRLPWILEADRGFALLVLVILIMPKGNAVDFKNQPQTAEQTRLHARLHLQALH